MDRNKPRRDVTAELRPRRDVSPMGEAGRYRALGTDPQMLWRPDKDDLVRLEGAGAVRVTVEIRAVEGVLREPCIYLDWGDGWGKESQRALGLVSEGVYTAVAHSDAGRLRRIRFDPSCEACDFELGSFLVEPAIEPSANIRRISPARRVLRAALRRLPGPAQNALRATARLAATPGRAPGRLVRGLRLGGDRWRGAYVRAFEVARNLRSPQFAAPPLLPPRRADDAPKVLAFYLPQFHPFPENDRWWGKGFTEWTNVSKATPQFVDHLQPRLPGELGFYDLRLPEVQRAQALQAERAGVDAFCFHYYWFAGQRLLERPLDAFVADPEITLPFALCWANENWTRRWDGLENDVLMAQDHSPEDDVAIIEDLARYMASPRYVRVDGRPLLIVYRPDTLPEARATIGRWRDRARSLGLGELFVLCTNAFGFSDYADNGFDGLVEFPPHALALGEITDQVTLLNTGFGGRVYDYETVARERIENLNLRRDPRRYPGVMPSWDNEARKPGAGHVFHNATPSLFHGWMKAALECTTRLAPTSERLVFVNAWNEWGEGAYLEPDRWFGFGSAQALRAAVEVSASRIAGDHPLVAASAHRDPARPAVVLAHIYYADLIEEFAGRLDGVRDKLDVIVTFPDLWTQDQLSRLAAAMPWARLLPVANVGRDIAPFLQALRYATDVGYTVFCKVHSKKSPHMASGDQWRNTLLGALISPEAATAALAAFDDAPTLGLLAPASARMRMDQPGVMFNNAEATAYLARDLSFTYGPKTEFPAGSMFWGRTEAFKAVLSKPALDYPFEVELGRIDGTLAHAFERVAGALVQASGHQVRWDL